MPLLAYEVTRQARFSWHVHADGPTEAIALVQDMGEAVADTTYTDYRAHRLGGAQPMSTLEELLGPPPAVNDAAAEPVNEPPPTVNEPAPIVNAEPQMADAPPAVVNAQAPVDVGTRFDLLMAAIQGHGVVEDRQAAAAGLPCFDVDLGDGKTATLATGVLGWLDAEQQEQICVRREPLTLPEDAMEHLRTYMAVAESCAGLPGTRDVIACVNRELEVRLPQ